MLFINSMTMRKNAVDVRQSVAVIVEDNNEPNTAGE
jgi:hypothetical protein